MKFEIQDETMTTFGKLRKGCVFLKESSCFVKHDDENAFVVYKAAGMMNAGDFQYFGDDIPVQQVTKLTASVN